MQEDLSTTGSIAAFVLTIFLSTALRSKPMLGTTPIPSDMLVWEELQWETKIFSELSTIELYQIMTLREQVFVVEQNCPYLDCDGKDIEGCSHVMGKYRGSIIAYCRVVAKGAHYDPNYIRIGRVINSQLYRGIGLGRQLMLTALKESSERYGLMPIKLGAQVYIKKFYESLGFVAVGDIYLEDGIPHIDMIKG